MTIWEFQAMVTRRLLLWSGGSLVIGAILWFFGPFWRGFATQALAWGAIDGLIAGAGQFFARRRRANLPDPTAPPIVEKETRNLRRLLWVNTGLDVFYMAGGLWLARSRGRTDAGWRGHGWGILVQGAFLFLFDLWHALKL